MPRLLLLLAAMLPGCGDECTLLYAPSGVSIGFEAESWAPGEWSVEVGDERCAVTLPVTAPTDVTCEDDGRNPRLELVVTADDQGLAGAYYLEAAPATLDVLLVHEGDVVVDETVSLTYTADEPNGPGCGDRFRASAVVAVE